MDSDLPSDRAEQIGRAMATVVMVVLGVLFFWGYIIPLIAG